MSSVSEVNVDIRDFLMSINLEQYLSCFHESGYNTVKDCEAINDSVLHRIGISPTGHRRRILKQLQIILSKMQDISIYANIHKTKKNDTSKDHQAPSSDQHTCVDRSDAGSVPTTSPPQLDTVTKNLDENDVTVENSQSLRSDDKLSPNSDLPISEELHPNLESVHDSEDINIESAIMKKTVDCTIEEPQTEKVNLISENLSKLPEADPECFSFKKSIRNEFLTREETLKGEPAVTGTSFIIRSSIYDNRKETVSEDKVEDIWIPRQDKNSFLIDSASESEYSTVEECFQSLKRKNSKASKSRTQKALNLDPGNRNSYPLSSCSGNANSSTISSSAISPYACFYGSSARKVKSGWLDKLSPQGKRMFQKRWVKFDGLSLSYYNNEKEMYSKGIIPLSAMSTVRGQGDNKFEVVTTQRTFVFRVEKEGTCYDPTFLLTVLWGLKFDVEADLKVLSILLNALKSESLTSQSQAVVTPEKCGYLELRGYKAKIFTVLSGNSVWLCKNEQDFKSGLGITIIPMNVANVKQVDRTVKQSFEIITPYRSFSFTAETEKEKQDWIEAVQQSIAETLSDYEVAEKIWFNESNRSCADCKAPDPDWASINLCVVICKKCAGQHRSLGPKDSKVRSLKMDASIWSNELIELFIVIGNKRANDFWAGNLQKDEELHMDSPVEKRKSFITQKYKEGKFRKTLLASLTKEELNKVRGFVRAKYNLWHLFIHVCCRPIFLFEIYLPSERVFLFGAETSQAQRKWTEAIAKHFVPLFAENLTESCTSIYQNTYYSSLMKKLLVMNNVNNSAVLPETEKITLYIHGHTKLDFTVWHTAIEKAAGTDGNALQDQQLSKNDVPIIVNSCIAFVTQY
ncbi:LOW QUALITY PROTEIN: arf-GAP with Rho-GAP domain, ANK repeat and PH domain-containing protein 2, partial [Otolemur garnettii]|uniref:LOW QUALITY PROTEIN: arf-GAP with Rho-GAP domain, ANK repeat and PH domain-containing protein 2 n=1 Tax=Otolemur garnettii TaxID=30611 RepID=UPI000C7F64F2